MLAGVAGRAAFATVLVAVADGHVIGTATVELDTTIEGTQHLQPGQVNFRLLAVDPPPAVMAQAVGWFRDASRLPAPPGRTSPHCTPIR